MRENLSNTHSRRTQQTESDAINSENLPDSEISLPSNWLSLPQAIEIDGRAYTALGRGAEAVAYICDDEVVKFHVTHAQSVEFLKHQVSKGHFPEMDYEKTATNLIAGWQASRERVSAGLDSGLIDPRIIANTRIDSEGRLRQSRLEIVGERLNQQNLSAEDPERVNAIIDAFAQFHLKSYESGLCETECSLFTNYGFYPGTDELTAHDFGNVTTNKEEALNSIKRPPTKEEATQWAYMPGRSTNKQYWADWFKKGQVRGALKKTPELYSYYVQKMSESLTPESLNDRWQKRLLSNA